MRCLPCEPASSDHDHVQPLQQLLVTPEALAHQSLDAVALRRAPDVLARDRESETRPLEPARPCQDGDGAAAGFLRLAKDARIVTRTQQSQAPRELVTRRAFSQPSRAEPSASLGTPRLDHLAPTLGGHTGTKAVAPLALQVTRLKWSFHFDAPAPVCVSCRGFP